MKAWFVHDPADLEAAIPGGVQRCSQEFLAVVRAAAGQVELVPVRVTRSPGWRLRRKLGLGAYLLYRPAEAAAAFTAALARLRPTHIFLNRSELMRLAGPLRTLVPEATIVLMSHGNQTGDELYEIAGPHGRRNRGVTSWLAGGRLGRELVAESFHRHHYFDGVCVMSEEEQVLERWLGARRTLVLPRVIRPQPLAWQPVPQRGGFVGTLDHTPNQAALWQLGEELERSGADALELRLVGGPEAPGRALAERFRFVTYLGRLDDHSLAVEAATWTLFLNPVFWLSRGASMKLGQALAWALPTLTTHSGRRGYQLEENDAWVTPDDPAEFVRALLRWRDNANAARRLHDHLRQRSWPTIEHYAAQLRASFPSR